MRILMMVVAVVALAAFIGAAPTSKPGKMKWVLADGAPSILQAVIDNQPALRETEIKRLEDWIEFREQMIKQVKNGKDKDKAETIQKFKADIDKAKAEIAAIKIDSVIVVSSKPPAKVGECGQVIQVVVSEAVDESNAIVDVVYLVAGLEVRGRGNNQTAHERSQPVRFAAWMTGFDASTWTDGQTFTPTNRYWLCDSTHKYDTVDGGARTLPELKPFTLDAFARVPAE